MPKTLMEQGEYKVPTIGMYTCEVLSVVEGPNKFYKNDDGTEQIDVTFKFKILDGEFTDSYVWGRTGPWFTNSPDCKLRIWVQEILGIDELPVGFELELEDLQTLKVQALVGRTKTGKAKVTDLLRVDKSMQTPAAAPTSAAATATASLGTKVDEFGEEPF